MKRILLALAVGSGWAALAGAAPIETSHFRFVPDPGLDAAARQLAVNAEQDRTTVALELGRDDGAKTTVRVVGRRAAFDALQPAGEPAPAWVSGSFDAARDQIAVLADQPGTDARRVLRGQLRGLLISRLAGARVPRWFVLGVATLRSGDGWKEQGPSLLAAARNDELIPLGDLAATFPARPSDAALAYAESADMLRYTRARFGVEAPASIFRRVLQGSTWDDAVTHVLGMSPRRWENGWRRTRMRWVSAMDFLTDGRTLWGLAVVLLFVAVWRTRRRRQLKLRLMALEERAEAARRLLRTPAHWADGPKARPVRSEEEALRSAPIALTEAAEEEPGAEAPKKPTLH